MAERLEERLVRHQRLLGSTAGEHDRRPARGRGGRARRPAGSCRSRRRRRARTIRPGRSALQVAAGDRPQPGRAPRAREHARPVAPRRQRRAPRGAATEAAGADATWGGRRGRRGPGPEEPLVHGDRLGRRRRPELVAQQRPQAVEHAQALGHVALRRQRLHQQHVAGLAVGLGLDQATRRALGRGQLRPADRQPGAPDHLERLQADVLELAAARLEPGGLRAGQQPAAGDVERDLRQRPGAAGVAALERPLGALDLAGPRPRRRSTPARGAPASARRGRPASGAERRAQPRQQRPQRGVLRARRAIGHSAPISSSRPTWRSRLSTR